MIAVFVMVSYLALLLEIIRKMLVQVVVEKSLDLSVDTVKEDVNICKKKCNGK